MLNTSLVQFASCAAITAAIKISLVAVKPTVVTTGSSQWEVMGLQALLSQSVCSSQCFPTRSGCIRRAVYIGLRTILDAVSTGGTRQVSTSQKCDGPIIALIPLLCGLRAREILERQVRDLDDNGKGLIVQRGRPRGTKDRGIAELLQPLVAKWAETMGVPSHVVASSLGHVSDQVTGRHYTLPSARQTAKQDQFSDSSRR